MRGQHPIAVLRAKILDAVTGVQLSHLYNSLVAHCQRGCDLATQQFLSHDRSLDHGLDLLAQVAPALIGVSGALRCSPASWRTAPTSSPGPKA
jgi:hypothetical protein